MKREKMPTNIETRYFTVDEANRCVKMYLRKIVEEIQIEYNRKIDVSRKIEDLYYKGNPYRKDLSLEIEYEESLNKLTDKIRDIVNCGAELADLQTGLVRFPAIRNNEDIYLCWKLGEPEVTHWHKVNEEYGERKSISELAA